jgi:hypothetical protein
MVFTAIAMRMGLKGDRYMVDASTGTLYINHLPLQMQEIANSDDAISHDVMISVKKTTISFQFINGINIECDTGTQGFMTKVVVGVPWAFLNQTRGLLGVLNGNPGDDLTPNRTDATPDSEDDLSNVTDAGGPVSVDSDLRTIHEEFGVTCKLVDGSHIHT